MASCRAEPCEGGVGGGGGGGGGIAVPLILWRLQRSRSKLCEVKTAVL